MNKKLKIMMSLENEVLTCNIGNHKIDFKVSNGVVNKSASHVYLCGGKLNSKVDTKLLKYFNSTPAFSFLTEYYEFLKADPKIVKLLVAFYGSFEAYYFFEAIGENIQKLKLAYTGTIKVAL